MNNKIKIDTHIGKEIARGCITAGDISIIKSVGDFTYVPGIYDAELVIEHPRILRIDFPDDNIWVHIEI